MTEQDKNEMNRRIDQIDVWLADPSLGIKLYQILSGAVRGPDDGVSKHGTTMNLRRICFPLTCKNGHTGMMSNIIPQGGLKGLTWSSGGSSHFKGHVLQAEQYLHECGRWPEVKSAAVAAKEAL